jgi:hypothetical protein
MMESGEDAMDENDDGQVQPAVVAEQVGEPVVRNAERHGYLPFLVGYE